MYVTTEIEINRDHRGRTRSTMQALDLECKHKQTRGSQTQIKEASKGLEREREREREGKVDVEDEGSFNGF